MTRDEIIKKLEYDKDIIYRKDFFDDIKGKSLLDFRSNINLIQDIRPTFYMEQKVDSYYMELLNKYDINTGLFLDYIELLDLIKNNEIDFLQNFNNYLINKSILIKLEDYMHHRDGIQKAVTYLMDVTSRKISEIVVDGLFKDSIYNVWINIREIIRYCDNMSNREKFISQDSLCLYKKILDIDNMDNIDKIKLYNDYRNKNIFLQFYFDWHKARRHSYRRLKDSLFNVKDKGNLFCYNNSLKKKVPIYELDGSDFFMLVSCRSEYKDVDTARRHCYTLISSYNMEVFSKGKFIYGYSDFSLDDIMHVFEKDIASNPNFNSNSFTTNFVNRIMTCEQINYSKGYNEIQMVNKRVDSNLKYFKIRKPNYLVVFDKIDERHFIEAKRLGIPIILIPTSKYKSKININSKKSNNFNFSKFDKILDTYTNDSYMEKGKNLRRL